MNANARQAALLVHAMAPQDRQWLLDALPLEQREPLIKLLDELRDLGIPADPHALESLTSLNSLTKAPVLLTHEPAFDPLPAPAHPYASAPAVPEPPPRPPDLDLIQSLDVLSDAQLLTLILVLRPEPPGLVARLLQLHDWSWRVLVLSELGALKKQRITQYQKQLAQNEGGEALDTALLQRLRHRIDQETQLLTHAAPARLLNAQPAPWWRRALRLGHRQGAHT